MRPRAERLAVVLAAFCVFLGAAPALAATTSVTDASGDYPDIRKLTLANNEHAVVLKQRYAELDEVQTESLLIKWGDQTHYKVSRANYDSDVALETRLLLVSPTGEEQTKSCADMTVSRNQETETSRFRVPRSCLAKAEDSVFAKGFATQGFIFADATRRTDKVDRG